ncbi:MAG TPA: hypothetical protein VF156_15560 [Agromyces sp.]
MRVRFKLEGYQSKLPHAAVAALEDEIGVPIERDASSYQRTFNAAPEGEAPRYETEPKEPDDAAEFLYVATHKEYEGDLMRVRAIVPSNVGIVVCGTGEPKPIADLAAAVQRLEARIAHSPPPGMDAGRYVNTKVDVHVPGNALLAIDEVCCEYDMCTDELAGHLERGWRIVAVCPQPDQRRPDYVLGRRRVEEP